MKLETKHGYVVETIPQMNSMSSSGLGSKRGGPRSLAHANRGIGDHLPGTCPPSSWLLVYIKQVMLMHFNIVKVHFSFGPFGLLTQSAGALGTEYAAARFG